MSIKFFRSIFVLGCLSLSMLAPAAYADEETPQSIPGGVMASAEKAKGLFDAGAVFIDARIAAEYAEQHIKGARNIPYKEKHARVSAIDKDDSFDLSKLPTDKSANLVFYCNGSPCWKGYKSAKAAIDAGYKKVIWFRDGLPAWKAKSYPVE
ncbi:MAG TPA: rhodanese-like domain-containing protein [Rhodocyclaceae bacterium]|nr:rhodanese-like domain-containing protein [Rhodocyclaceae bacterium]